MDKTSRLLNHVLVLAALGVLALLGYGAYLLPKASETRGGNDAVAAALAEHTPTDNSPHQQQQLDKLAVTMARLNDKVSLLEQKLNAVDSKQKHDNSPTTLAQHADSQRTPIQASTLAQEDAWAGEEEAYQTQQRSEYLVDQATYEEYDAVWAQTMEEGLTALSERLSQFDLKGTHIVRQDCRSTLCVVEFTHNSESERDLLPALISVPGASEVSLQHSAHNPLTTIAVFAREGHQLPKAPGEMY